MESDRRSIKDSFSSRFFLFTSLRIRGKWSKINNGFIFFIPIFPDHESCLFFFLFLSIYLVHEFSRTKINSNESKMQIHFLLSLYFSPFSYSFLQELVESDRRSIKDSFFSRFFLFTSSKTRGKWSKINKRFIFFIPIFPHLVHTFIFQDWVENANSFSSRFFLFTSSSTRSTTDSFSLFQFFLILFTRVFKNEDQRVENADSFSSLPLFFFIFLIYFFKHSWKVIENQQQIHFLYSTFSPSCSHVHFSRTKINESRLIFFLPPPNFSYSRTRGNRRSTSRERRTLV